MRRIAILMTCHNRKEKTLRCLDSLRNATIEFDVFLTDDGCTDGTADAIRASDYGFSIEILQADGTLFWNAGMNNSWRAAIAHGGYDGYLWLNDDVVVLPVFWQELKAADDFSKKHYGRSGIYVGSTKDAETGAFSYGGFFFISKLPLRDKFVHPDGKTFQECEAAHGNVTYISHSVVERRGILYSKYFHGCGDHDYTYLAHKAGFPILVLPSFSAVCENDRGKKPGKKESFRDRIRIFNPPKDSRSHITRNILLFNLRCFPLRLPIVLVSEFFKVFFPRFGYGVARALRK